jgi:hypothetical protein
MKLEVEHPADDAGSPQKPRAKRAVLVELSAIAD